MTDKKLITGQRLNYLFGGYFLNGQAFNVADMDKFLEHDFGRCCVCLLFPATQIILIPIKSPLPNSGWGCLQCGLPFDGAIAVACPRCMALYQAVGPECVQEFVYGKLGEHARLPIADLADPATGKPHYIKHNTAYHPECVGGLLGQKQFFFGMS